MRIERAVLLVVALGIGPACGTRLQAQDPLTSVGPATEVRSIHFRFIGHRTLQEADLRRQIALTERGRLGWLHKVFGWLPLISPAGKHPFDPLVLQRDVVRLRHYCQREGFPDAVIDYDVRYEAEDDLVDITFVVREGPPLLVASISFQGLNGPPLLAPELERPWQAFVQRERRYRGRFSEGKRQALVDRTARWLRNRGYPFALAQARVDVDSVANRASVAVRCQPGARARIRDIAVAGNQTIPARDVTRQLPIAPGDWYDAARLEQGRQKLTQLDLIRLALLNVPRETLRDSSVEVRVRVTENPPRLIRGDVGAASNGGLTGQADWTHRSFLGGLRTFTLGAAAQTGLASLENPPEERYRLALSLFQPYIGDRRVSLAAGPFGEYRNDLRERSWRVGLETSLVFATGPLRSIALGYTFSHRRVLNYGFANQLDPIEYLPLLGLAPPDVLSRLGNVFDRSTVTLEGSWGRLDRFANPRKGYVLRPRIEVTAPFLNTNQYVLLEAGATGFLPLSRRIGFTLRTDAGRLYPFGKSLQNPAEESPFVSLLRLRDATFTAGGTRDVRGWGGQLLGPKLPRVEPQTRNGATMFVANGYTPIGGLARLMASAELHFPLPGLGDKWESFTFLDGARIWTPDSRFRLEAGDLEQDRFFLGTGAGVGYETVVGAIQVAVGYKLNPSALDLRDPRDVLQALLDGRPLSGVPADSRRRWHLHFSIGATF
jgi:outer membrane protein insertion porin family